MIKIKPESRIDAVEIHQPPRTHLGGSLIGHACDRYKWYNFHWAYDNSINARSNRIFRLGDAIEQLIIDDLARIGMVVTNQQEYVTGFWGHGGGSIDGRIGTSLFEAKSMNDSNFKMLKKLGVKEGFPVYYSQIQYYMGYLKIEHCWFCSMNKNTQELWLGEVEFDQDEFERLQAIESRIVLGELEDFEKLAQSSNWYQCRFCPASDVCHDGHPLQRNCRTCISHDLNSNGSWRCTRHNVQLNVDEQLAACPDHSFG